MFLFQGHSMFPIAAGLFFRPHLCGMEFFLCGLTALHKCHGSTATIWSNPIALSHFQAAICTAAKYNFYHINPPAFYIT